MEFLQYIQNLASLALDAQKGVLYSSCQYLDNLSSIEVVILNKTLILSCV